MKRTGVMVCFVALLLLPAIGAAFNLEKGDKEIGINLVLTHATVSVNMDEGDDEDVQKLNFSGNFLFGYFLTNKWELGGLMYIDWMKGENGETVTDTLFTPAVWGRYHFGEGRIRPYAGLSLGYKSSDFSNDSDVTMAGGIIFAQGGVKYFLTEKALVNFEYNLGWTYVDFDAEYRTNWNHTYTKSGNASGFTGLFFTGLTYLF